MQRLGTPYTELPVEDLFPGVTIMSNLLPAVLDDQVLPWEQADKPLPMISAKSRGHKAVLEARSKAHPRNPPSWQQPNSTGETNAYSPPTPPPPPERDTSKVQNTTFAGLCNKPKGPWVPPPPKPRHGREVALCQSNSEVTTESNMSEEHASWGQMRQDTWHTHSSPWKKG